MCSLQKAPLPRVPVLSLALKPSCPACPHGQGVGGASCLAGIVRVAVLPCPLWQRNPSAPLAYEGGMAKPRGHGRNRKGAAEPRRRAFLTGFGKPGFLVFPNPGRWGRVRAFGQFPNKGNYSVDAEETDCVLQVCISATEARGHGRTAWRLWAQKGAKQIGGT